jgi:hypothetical protein
MSCGENAWQHFLCYRAQREYVAGHNKLLLIYCVLRSEHLPAAHIGDPTKARIYPKGHK